MVTTLYVVSMSAWYALSVFIGDTQVKDCSQLRDRIVQEFSIEATCISKGEHILIQDRKVYLAALPKK